jgi:hypothetical protein
VGDFSGGQEPAEGKRKEEMIYAYLGEIDVSKCI